MGYKMHTVLCIDVMETPSGFMVLFEDEYLQDEEGYISWDTFAQAMAILKTKLEVTT